MQTQTHWQEQLDRLTEKVLRLGGMVEEAIGRATRALVDRDSDQARQVIETDRDVDRLELEIDDLCMEMLGLFQPLARDLRFVTMAMKITTDLERIGDLAVNISERALELNEEPQIKPFVDLPLMANRAQEMLRSALDAFVRRDATKARATIEMDDALDRRMEQVFRELLTYMIEDPKTISRALRLTFVAKYFERIGDMATNICEQVVYLEEGEVIKHPGLREEDESKEGPR
jgi:phosphate transport system protein